jgi:hypothetical protein
MSVYRHSGSPMSREKLCNVQVRVRLMSFSFLSNFIFLSDDIQTKTKTDDL